MRGRDVLYMRTYHSSSCRVYGRSVYDLYKAFAEAFRENEREEQEFSEELKEAVKKAYGNGLNAGRHSHLSAPASLSEGRPGREQYDGFYAWYAAHGR